MVASQHASSGWGEAPLVIQLEHGLELGASSIDISKV